MKKRIFMRSIALLTVLGLVAVYSSCKKEESETPNPPPPPGSYNPTPYVFDLPDHFPRFFQPKDNEATEEGVLFGRHIYYDPMLSEGGPQSPNACASCHTHTTNFTSSNLVGGNLSVMSHTNLQWTGSFLWDGRKEGSLEDVMLFEITEFFQADIDLFAKDTMYQRLCFEAFGSDTVTAERMSYAMAQWVRSMISANSRWDKFFAGEVELTPLELRGKLLFESEAGDCFHCHSTPLTTDLLFHNNGIDSVFTNHQGRFVATGNEADIGLFKTPSLRNIEKTAPYMHDGRFATLEEVVEHYNSGVKLSKTLDPIMTKAGKENGLNLSEYDKSALVAYLKTLTDEDYLKDEKYNNPFK